MADTMTCCACHQVVPYETRTHCGKQVRQSRCRSCRAAYKKRWRMRQSAAYHARELERDKQRQQVATRRRRVELYETAHAIVTTLLARGYTRERIARETGIHRSTIARYAGADDGVWFGAETVRKLADWYVSIS